jgi:quercetin dioxygenase-like cupin family protein
MWIDIRVDDVDRKDDPMTALQKDERAPRGMPASETIVRRGNEGPAVWFLGGLYEIKATSRETNGEMSVVRISFAPGASSPPHVHDCGETMFILEGALRVYRGEDHEPVDLGPGDLVYFPQGTLEWAENHSNAVTRALVIYAPGGMDEFFVEAGRPAAKRELPLASDEAFDEAKLEEIAARHGLKVRPKASD